MSGTNNFLPFCPTDSGTNLLTQSEYAAATDRTVGNQPGVASSKLNNKALRQSSFITSQLAQYMANQSGVNVLDDGVSATLLAQITGTFGPIAPQVQKFLSGSGNYNASWVFTIASGSATAGATYTNNTNTYTVVATVASGTQIVMTGGAAPTVSGTLTKSAGTGDASLTFFVARAPLYLKGKIIGGGGAGSSSGLVPPNGGDGGTTTFGSLITATGGTGGLGAGAGGLGGTCSFSAGVYGTPFTGGTGGGFIVGAATTLNSAGTSGGVSPFGGAGGSGLVSTDGTNAVDNTGSGGGGGGSGSTGNSYSGTGGGAGGFGEFIIPNPAFTYPYAIGAGGTPGAPGTSGNAGGAGAKGIIYLEEHYQ